MATNPTDLITPQPIQPRVAPLQVYTALQAGYFDKLNQPAQPAPPPIDDEAYAQVQQHLAALRESHPLLNGQAPAHPDSALAKMTAGQIGVEVGKETWQQMVTQPFHDFMDTWKHDWKTGLLETVGGVALIGGLVGLEALSGGAATPFIFAAAAALVAPGMIKSWADEVQNPTDANLVKALVSTSTGVLTVGVPTRFFSGLERSGRLLRDALGQTSDIHSVDEAANLAISGQRRDVGRQLIRNDLPVEQQLEVLQNRPEDLRSQFDRLGVDMKDAGVKELLQRSEQVRIMQTAVKAARKAKDEEGAKSLEVELKRYLSDPYKKAHLRVANDWLFLPDRPYQHVPLTPVEDVPFDHQEALDTHTNGMLGTLRSVGLGHGLSVQSPLKSIVEVLARDRASGTRDSVQQLQTNLREMVKKLGLKDAEIEQTLQGIEEPDIWGELSPTQQALGQRLVQLQNVATANELRRGTISTALLGAVPRFSVGIGDPAGPSGQVAGNLLMSWLRGSTLSQSRKYQVAEDVLAADPEFHPTSKRSDLAAKYPSPEAQAAAYGAQTPYLEAQAVHGDAIVAGRRRKGGLAGSVTVAEKALAKAASDTERVLWQNRLAERQDKVSGFGNEFLQSLGESPHAQTALELVQMEGKALDKLARAAPPSRQLVTGLDAMEMWFASHALRMNKADFGDFFRHHANLNVEALKAAVPKKLPMGDWANYMEQAIFKDTKGKPDILPATAFAKGPESTDRLAELHGYFLIHPAVGRAGDLHYQPALYARDEVSAQILKALDAVTEDEAYHGVAAALYKVSNWQRALTFITPFWHAFNVAGRAIGFFLADPAVAGAAGKALRELKLHDPQGYEKLRAEMSMSGIRHADRFHVGEHLHILEKERTGQYSTGGALRTVEGLKDHYYQDLLERGFWKAVDDVQAMGYVYARQTLRDRLPNASEAEIRMLAAEYGNNLAGMVNPLYMSRLYKHMRGLIWFAPSYWATMLRGMASSFPGAARLSQFLADQSGGRYVRFGAVPLRTIDQRSRIELTRLQRQWTITYLMTSAMVADGLNVVLGGRHLWENDQGHMFDVNVDKLQVPGPIGSAMGLTGPQTLPGGETRHSYVTGIPFFRQGADVMNMLGLGHDWGWGHQLSDATFQKQDANHKAYMLTGALADGIRRTLVTKASGVPQAAFGLATGDQWASATGQGVRRQVKGPIGRFGALLNLIPAGNSVESAMTAQANLTQNYQPGTPQYAQAQKQAQQSAGAIGASLFQTFSGVPTVHHMGVERSSIDDDKMQAWHQNRNDIHTTLNLYSKAVFNGQITPIEYVRHKQDEMTKLAQLDADTFGLDSPGGSLAAKRHELAGAFGLLQQGLSDDAWFARYEVFQPAWEQVLQAASPSTRASWWDISTSLWTDADYLEWQASQLRKALASSIDGVGGQHIRAYQSSIAPYLSNASPAEIQQMEAADPYYYTYRTLLKSMSRTSALGAFVSAFSSPYSKTRIVPNELSDEELATLQERAPAGDTFIRQGTAEQLAQQAKQVAKEPGVAEAGGQATQSPTFDAAAEEAVQAAEAGVNA